MHRPSYFRLDEVCNDSMDFNCLLEYLIVSFIGSSQEWFTGYDCARADRFGAVTGLDKRNFACKSHFSDLVTIDFNINGHAGHP